MSNSKGNDLTSDERKGLRLELLKLAVENFECPPDQAIVAAHLWEHFVLEGIPCELDNTPLANGDTLQ